MASDIKQFTQSLKDSSPRTRWIAIAGVLLVVVAFAVSSVIAARPHFVLLHSQIDDSERIAVEKALAGANIRYRISQPPGPYVLDVDEAQFYEAQNAVALAGAMHRSTTGIETGSSGATTIFMTAAERAQTMQKREWQELENQLGCLDFVASAKVTTSVADNSPLRARKPVTVSVTLALRGATELTSEQAENVARIVRYRFDVPAQNVVVTDQRGHTLFAGESGSDVNTAPADHGEFARNYDRVLEVKANEALSRTYGPNKGYVTLASEWDYDLRTIEADDVQAKGALIEDEKTETVTPAGTATPESGGAAGTSSNIAVENPAAASAAAAAQAASAPAATTSDQKKRYETGRTKTRTVHSTPTLKRLSVSLVLDESLNAKRDEIGQLVEAIVGFEKKREDVLRVSTTAIAVPPAEVPGTTDKPVVSEGMSPTLKLVLQHGIELMAAAVFLFIALKAMKGVKKGTLIPHTGGGTPSASSASGGFGRALPQGGEVDDAEPDPELLARVRVEELVRSDPRRVGEILSRWATENTKPAGSSR